MPGCAQLAAEESEGLLNATQLQIEQLLGEILRGSSFDRDALAGVRPQAFLAGCRQHGVSGLVYDRLRAEHVLDAAPQAVREGLEEAAAAAVAHDLLRQHRLVELLRVMEQAALPVLITKGEALARLCYPIPGTRPRSDTDMFIAIRDLSKVRSLLGSLGYRTSTRIYARHQFTAIRSGDAHGAVRLDVHWRILNHPAYARCLAFEEAYRHSIDVPGLEPARTLCLPDALLLACLHRHAGFRHDPDRLVWLVDIRRLLGAMHDAEIREFGDRAGALGVQDACLDGIQRSAEILGWAMPEDLSAALRGPRQTADDPRGSARRARWALLRDDWRNLPGWRERAGLMFDMLVPSPGALLERYDKRSPLWIPWLYLRRMVDGLSGAANPGRY